MTDPVVVVGVGGEEFSLVGLKVQEMAKVRAWTSIKNRAEWWERITDEDPDALLAGYMLVKHRRGETLRWEDADFDLDTFTVKLVDGTGREVEPVLEKLPDGTLKTDADGRVIPVLKDGQRQWTYTDTGDAVPTEAA